MLAAGYHQPTARSADVKVASNGPSTRLPRPARPPPREPSNGSGEAKVKCENAPWIRVSDFTGLAAPVAVPGRPDSAYDNQAGPETVADQVDARTPVSEASSGPSPFCADDAGAVLHLVVAQRAQHLTRARPQCRERISDALRVVSAGRSHRRGMAQHGYRVGGEQCGLTVVLGTLPGVVTSWVASEWNSVSLSGCPAAARRATGRWRPGAGAGRGRQAPARRPVARRSRGRAVRWPDRRRETVATATSHPPPH